jgi:DNA-directed RNA polymerase subunit RPC12/RpoP
MDKSYIIKIIKKIVAKEFQSGHETSVIEHQDRAQFRCPYCHEGRTKTKKRGNIYYNKLLYICFRCGKKTNFDRFCKDFNEQIEPSKKLEMIQHLESVVTYSDYEDDIINSKFEDLIKISDIEDAFNSNITPITNFEPIKVGGGVYKYLLNRGIPPLYHRDIYQAKYWKNEDEFEWVIAMLNRRGDRLLGMQIRNLKSGKKRWFKIFNYENLLEWVNRYETSDKDANKIALYNKLSYYFNILNVDFTEKVTVFEGYIDSLFFPNSIGLVGVNTSLLFLENNNIDIQYLFDNDDVGFKKSEQKIKSGYSVFLWKKLFEDIVKKKKTNDPWSLLHRISKVKDINKLSELIEDPYSKLELYKYFSNDIFDIKWIPKIQYKAKIIDRNPDLKLNKF